MNWRIKGITQKILGIMPGGVPLNDLLQRSVGGLRDFPNHVASRVFDDWVVLASYMKELGVELAGLFVTWRLALGGSLYCQSATC